MGLEYVWRDYIVMMIGLCSHTKTSLGFVLDTEQLPTTISHVKVDY